MKSRAIRFLLAGATVFCVLAALQALTRTEAFAQIRATFIKNIDEPYRTPFETRSQFLPNAGGCFGVSDCFNYSDGAGFALFDLRPVPAGKRWVVQSAMIAMTNGFGRTNNIQLGSPRGGIVFDGTKWIYGGPFFEGTNFGSAIASAKVDVTFGPGETPFVRVTGSPNLSGYTVIVFSGYLIDAAN